MQYALPAFPVDVLPERLACYIRQAAESLSCPVDFVGAFSLAVLSSAVGTAHTIRVKTGWTEPALLYTAVVAPPASKKSPAFKAALKPVYEKLKEHKRLYGVDKAEYEVLFENYEANKKQGAAPPPKPVMARNYVSDFTIEALARLLEHNPKGLLLALDELAAWIKSMDQYRKGKGSDLDKWLSMWTCSPFTVDRASKDEPTVLECPFVSVTGGIQPDRLKLFRSSEDDGFMERILFAFPEPVPDRWTEDVISPTVSKAYCDLYDELYALQPERSERDGSPEPVVLDFTKAAKQRFVKYYHHNLADIEAEPIPYLKATFKKIEAYTARFALLVQLCIRPDSLLVDTEAMGAAVALAEYFKANARKVNAHINGEQVKARILAAVAALQSHGGPMTLRECYTKRVAGCKNAKAARQLFDELVEEGYGRMKETVNSSGGRPTLAFHLRTYGAAIQQFPG